MKSVFVYEHLSGGAAADGSALLDEGLAMRDALLADLRALPNWNAEVGSARGGETALDVVAGGAARHALVWVVAPETAGRLARLQRAVPCERWLGCSAAAIATASSKQATLRCLAARGICTPLAFDHATRWVVKPDDGAGALQTQVHADRAAAVADLAQRAGRGEVATLEPWVEGEAMSLSLLCSARGAELLSVNRQNIGIDESGRVALRGLTLNTVAADDPRRALLQGLASNVFGAIAGLRGFVGLDFVWHPQRGPVVIELNPRLTSAYVGLSAAIGRNLAGSVVAAHTAEFGDA